MLDTSTSICHHMIHFSIMMHDGYLDTSKAMQRSDLQNHWTFTSHINNDVQVMINVDMVQGCRREAHQNFGRGGHGER